MPRTNQNQERSRNYCFTINNYSDEDLNKIKTLDCRYCVCGLEVGVLGTPHLQGYVVFKSAKTLSAASKIIPRAHLEVAKGDIDANYAYCTKEKNFIEFGDKPISKKDKGKLGGDIEKARWLAIWAFAKEGKLEELAEEEPQISLKYRNALLSVAKQYAPMPDNASDCTGEWYYGPSGSGKSRKAREENPGAYLKMCNKWFDGYQNEEVVILEDFDSSHAVLGHHLKIWADRYAFPAEIKGGKINIRPQKIIVTSNYHPEEIWAEKNTLEPILRRFKITHIPLRIPQIEDEIDPMSYIPEL